MKMKPLSVQEQLRRRYENLSRTLRRTASWILANPAEVATRPLNELSTLSGHSSASFIRLAQELGYDGWKGLREGFAQVLRDGAGESMFAERLTTFNYLASPQAMLRTELKNVQRCYTPENAEVIDETVERMVGAQRIALIGRRSCTPVVTWLHYLLRITCPGAILADDRGGAFGLDLLGLGKDDIVISASFSPCSRETVSATRRASKAGAWTLGIVDAPLSALARVTDRRLLVGKESDAFFDSMVGAMAAVQWLASAWTSRMGAGALQRAREYQRLMVETGAFEPDE